MHLIVNCLPAKYGDCLLIEYGQTGDEQRILIDGGTGGTKHALKAIIDRLPPEKRRLELLVVSHIDRDHIEGILSLLEENDSDLSIDDIWFNGWNHLPGNPEYEFYGAKQGERLTSAILEHKLPWNKAFSGKSIVVPATGDLPAVQLPGGMKLTLLSPLKDNLVALKKAWEKEILDAGLLPGFGYEEPVEAIASGVETLGAADPDIDKLNNTPFIEDHTAGNGSSIAFLAEYGNKKMLFAADAFPSVILGSLNRLFPNEAAVDLFKISHHASAGNTSPQLLKKVTTNRYLISTNGSIYHHPSPETIARIIRRSRPDPLLIFNYRTGYNEMWDDKALKFINTYRTAYPGTEGIQIRLF